MSDPAPLRVGAALPDPPFEFTGHTGPSGFDVELLQAIAAKLGRPWQLIPFEGADFNDIFAGLDSDLYDCVASGTTITPARAGLADFCAPYAISGQSLITDTKRHPSLRSIDELAGLTIAVQRGNTSQPVAEKLVAEGRAAKLRVYDYGEIETALADLSSGGCDAFMKLAPVAHWFVRAYPDLAVVQAGITSEELGICVAKGNTALHQAINAAQAALQADGTLPALIEKWLGLHAKPA